MPILWRYLIHHFLKIMILCVLAFVAILLTMRLDEIAHFAALGTPLSYILLFTFYQIPYILPIAIPISCLIAAFILVQRLSSTHELTAMRACGLACRDILMPLLCTALFLFVLNFWIVSEAATQSHLMTNSLKSEFRSINPLLLLNNKHLMRMKGIYFDALGPSKVGEVAMDAVLAIPNKHHQRLNLMVAHELRASSTAFNGHRVTLLSNLGEKQSEGFDDLLIENIQETETSIPDFSQILQKKVWSINNDYLKMSLLLTRIQEQKEALVKAKEEKLSANQIKSLKYQLNRSLSDISRRFSIAIAVFSFTLMGATFGIHISRHRKRKTLYLAIFLTAFYLVTFFLAKGLDQYWEIATALYMIPHFILIGSSIYVLNRITKGIE